MRDPSDLNTLESADERLDQALRKLAGLDQLVKEGRSHHLMPGLTKASIPDPLFTTPDVGGAQATFTKGLMTQPASSSSIRDSSIFSSFPEDSLCEFDASQEFARQVVHTSRTPALSFADRRTLDSLKPSQAQYQPKTASVQLLSQQDQFTEKFRNINNFQDLVSAVSKGYVIPPNASQELQNMFAKATRAAADAVAPSTDGNYFCARKILRLVQHKWIRSFQGF